ncbi:hypothetical protein BDD12DRAFT_806685 [Trichophaea hybrida]|nr:hypothetical protein BDD12DRAFT_806685 [Trichophaea hybrida]
MSSVCGSPFSQRSSRSSTTSPLSPQTAVTTPRSCNGDFSPKLDSSSYNCFATQQPLTPPPEEQIYTHMQSLSQSEPPVSTYSVSIPQLPTTPLDYSIDGVASTAEEPSTYDQLFSPYCQQELPTSNFYYDSPTSPTTVGWGGGYSGWAEYSRWTGYTGYPPASAFYGPLPTAPTESPLSTSASPSTLLPIYEPIDPTKYEIEQWQTSDGRLVEYSAMHLHCATM